jgi:hypothetical protein
MKAVLIKMNGTKEVVEFERGQSYDMLREAVGGLFQPVALPSKKVDMWVNEEGKFMEHLFQNPIGTALWAEDYGLTDVIIGDIIITGGADEEGDTIGLNDTELSEIMAFDRVLIYPGLPTYTEDAS